MGILSWFFGESEIEEPGQRADPDYWWSDSSQAEMKANEPQGFFDGFI